MKIIYFTGTGNCLYVAKKISGNLLSIPQLINNEVYNLKDDMIGIIFPCYFWTMPRIVEQYLKKVKIKAEYIFIIVTYGTFSQSAIKQAENILKAKNIKVNYTDQLKMVDNYLPNFYIEKELEKKDSEIIDSNIEKIINNIKSKKIKKLKKKFYNDFFSLIGKIYRNQRIDKIDKNFIVNNHCNLCEICIRVCPVNNIDIIDDNINYNHNCEYCLSCINLCSQNAIHLKNEKSSVRFRNQNIKTTEIIKSNNQSKNLK